jgi:acetyl esterase
VASALRPQPVKYATHQILSMSARAWALSVFLSLMLSFTTNSICAPVTPARQLRDVEYSRVDGISLRLDASLPASAGPTAAAIIVHGGGWTRGDRRIDVQPLFKPLTDAGFAWFSISYRLATDITQFGIAVDDVEQAVRFVKTHAGEFNIDPNRIALIGESAGGQLAALAALRAGPDASVRAVVALYTPTDLISLFQDSTFIPAQIRNGVRGTPWEHLIVAGLSRLSPIENVRRDMPPFLLIHGTADSLVPFAQSTQMCARMRQMGASCEIYPVEGAGHGVRWWESSSRLATGYKHKMVHWLEEELGYGPPDGRDRACCEKDILHSTE